MPLKLRVISDQYKELGKTSSFSFGVTGGRIGRAPDNDWVLPDPDRYVSSHHAKVSFRTGTWILEDTSTNGVFVNDSDIPLSVSGPRKLKDGDRLRFGDYDIIVSMDEKSDAPREPRGPSAALNTSRQNAAGRVHQEADYLRHGTFRNHSRSRTREHMGDDLGEDLDITGLLVPGAREEVEENDAVAAFDRGAPTARPPEPWHANPASPPPESHQTAAPPTAAPKSKGPTSLLDDLLEVDPTATGAYESDDWHMSTRRLEPRKVTNDPVPVLEVPRSAAQRDVAPKRAEAPPRERPKPESKPASKPEARNEVTRPEVMRSEAVRPEPARPEPVRLDAERARRTAEAASTQAAMEAFCRGAGIPYSSIPTETHTAILSLAGQVLRETALDLMEALRSRNEQKTQLNIEVTGMQPGLNNPLKFAPSVEEALRRLLEGPGMRYMGGVEAVREAFTDLRNHQLALDTATQAAVNDLLGRVDPMQLQERFDRGMKRNPAAGAGNKAKYWDLFCEFYPLLNQRDTRGWPAVFSQEFARAYDEGLEQGEERKRR